MATISRRVASGPVGKSSALSYSVATDRQSTGRLEGNALMDEILHVNVPSDYKFAL